MTLKIFFSLKTADNRPLVKEWSNPDIENR